VEVSCGPDECRVWTASYDKPPFYTPVYRGDLSCVALYSDAGSSIERRRAVPRHS